MITLFSASLRYLGLSQSEASGMLGIPEQRVKNMASGRSRVPPGIWAELSTFARRRDAEVAKMRTQAAGYTLDDANFVLSSMDGAPPGFPCADSYVTMLAAAVLTSGSENAGA